MDMGSLNNVCCDTQHTKSGKEYYVAIEDFKHQDNTWCEPRVFFISLFIFFPSTESCQPKSGLLIN